MSRARACLLVPVLLLACELPTTSDRDTLGSDTAAPADTAAPNDTQGTVDPGPTGTCTTHRDCFTQPGDRIVCDASTGQCVTARPFLLPCDTDADCKTYYNTSMKVCSAAKFCAMPCIEPGESESSTCPYGNRQCGFQSMCECTTDAKCGEGSVCSAIAKVCVGGCKQDGDCVAITGSTCDTTTGQCVR